jgi:hypothetical protein
MLSHFLGQSKDPFSNDSFNIVLGDLTPSPDIMLPRAPEYTVYDPLVVGAGSI